MPRCVLRVWPVPLHCLCYGELVYILSTALFVLRPRHSGSYGELEVRHACLCKSGEYAVVPAVCKVSPLSAKHALTACVSAACERGPVLPIGEVAITIATWWAVGNLWLAVACKSDSIQWATLSCML